MPTDSTASDYVERLYPALKSLARNVGWRYGTAETLRNTALVNETFLKLRHSHGFADEAHFLRTAAIAMRQVVIGHARERLSAKRGGGAARGGSDELDDAPFWENDERLLALDEALDQLGQLDPRLVQVVEYRFYAGYSEAETAKLMNVSDRTVRRDWIKARAFLLTSLKAEPDTLYSA